MPLGRLSERRADVQEEAERPLAFPRTPLRFVGHYLWKRKVEFGLLFLIVIGATACAVGVQYAMKLLVDGLAAGGGSSSLVWWSLVMFMSLIAVENVLWRSSGWVGSRAVVRTGVAMRLDLLQHLTGHTMRFFSEHLAGSLATRVTNVSNSFYSLMTTFVWNVIPPLTDFLGAFIIFATIDYRMALALLLFYVMVAVGLAFISIRGQPLHRAYADRAGAVGGEVVDVVSNIWSIKAFAASRRELSRLSTRLDDEATSQRRSWLFLEKTRIVHDLALWFAAGAMLIWVIVLWSAGSVTPGDVVVVSALTFRILHGSRDLAFSLINQTKDLGVIGEALRTISKDHEVVDSPDAKDVVAERGSLEFKDVTFVHSGGFSVFDKLNLRIEPGEKVGIVGPSGAGKSTLLGLIQRLYDPQSGEIRIDGHVSTELTQDALRSSISVVPQDISLFHRSLRENIRFGRPDATDAEVEAAARAAQCEDFIHALEHGYDTVVGERGAKLSGGQRQRIGIARALLKNAPILVLDEATSALDTESERAIQKALVEAGKGRTVMAVAHRLSTLTSFDRIIVIVNGEIVEEGPPTELMRAGGMFETLWSLQAEALETAGSGSADGVDDEAPADEPNRLTHAAG
ncbi:ABC transporter ATP-binding protein [Marinivivus vitaminiproducens]|uniref:ABC transporter ATP-binding protein n=1 Tax=Marinivivus vitaminiproducens TaxID=3035935 RepID=UPI00279BAE98|nr:ABC transporter ATP-binding protein [Geminicoccaceae bacterium SCSIO 64248]